MHTTHISSKGDDALSLKAQLAGLELPQPNLRRHASTDTLSLLAADDLSELHLTRTSSPTIETAPVEKNPNAGRLRAFWIRNKGVLYVLVSQFFGTMMGVATRFLELEGEGMDPFQILFARMSVTVALSLLYMWWKKVPDAPLGAKSVRVLLAARGIGGFFGVFGLYWSLQYLPLADATVIGFLSPTLASYACSKLINEPFTRVERIAGGISFLGVVLIAQPASLFSTSSHQPASDPIDRRADSPDAVTPAHRLEAIGMSLVAVLGAACAYTTIRWIGQRAHPLISVNYFASWCTLVSTSALLFAPGVSFRLPATPRQWSLLLALGGAGFAMQFLLTAGLRYEKGSRSQNMIYSQMLFALASDKIIFGTSPDWWSGIGSGLILGCAVWVAMQKAQRAGVDVREEGEGGGPRREVGAPRDEEEEAVGLMVEDQVRGGVEMDDLDRIRSPEAP